jgi:hypothetical protein
VVKIAILDGDVALAVQKGCTPTRLSIKSGATRASRSSRVPALLYSSSLLLASSLNSYCRRNKKYGTCEEVWNGFAQQTNGKLTKDQLAIGRGGKIVTKSRQINAISSNTLRTSQATSLKQRYVKDTNHLFLIDSIHYKKIYGSREEVWGGDAYKVKVEV